jgi:para-aminobenzoate synthetase component 2
MIDNYDSFTFNLVHYFQALGQEVAVHRNDQITLTQIAQMSPQYIVISPGPSDPDNAGMSLAIIEAFVGKIPILGVCLGHQCIAQYFGAKIAKSKKMMHGKTSDIQHFSSGIFQQLNNPLRVTRYHSLIVAAESLPEQLCVNAWSCDTSGAADEIMALQHQHLPVVGVQFHPESILTEQGDMLLRNFLTRYKTFNKE